MCALGRGQDPWKLQTQRNLYSLTDSLGTSPMLIRKAGDKVSPKASLTVQALGRDAVDPSERHKASYMTKVLSCQRGIASTVTFRAKMTHGSWGKETE